MSEVRQGGGSSQATKFCHKCGEEVFEEAVICPACGVEQHDRDGAVAESTSSSRNWKDQYSMLTWVGAVVVGLLTLPIGLVIPAYFYVKANGDEPPNQGTLECATIILWGILGIAAVELGGKRGAKILWGIMVALVFLFFLGVFALAAAA